jgi:hypothetical protein
MQGNTKLSPAERAMYFSQATRQNMQVLPAIAGAENGTISFSLPKVRLLSKVRLLVTAVLNAQHAALTTYAPGPFAPYGFIRRVAMEVNNGFSPFILSGRELYWYNLVRAMDNNLNPVYPVVATTLATCNRSRAIQEIEAAAAPGADNIVKFVVDLPVTLNDRDPVGLLLLQNEETVVTVTVDFDGMATLAPAVAGFTFALSNIVVTPIIETFSVPAVAEARPDLSMLKLVHSTRQNIAGAGPITLSLPVGNTYRKLILYLESAVPAGFTDGAFAGDFELVFNQADIPYRINPHLLAAINQEQFGALPISDAAATAGQVAGALPQGLYAFDFSYQGLSGYGGSRDFVDTERLTEFWFRFTAPAAGTVTAVYETLSRLR